MAAFWELEHNSMKGSPFSSKSKTRSPPVSKPRNQGIGRCCPYVLNHYYTREKNRLQLISYRSFPLKQQFFSHGSLTSSFFRFTLDETCLFCYNGFWHISGKIPSLYRETRDEEWIRLNKEDSPWELIGEMKNEGKNRTKTLAYLHDTLYLSPTSPWLWTRRQHR